MADLNENVNESVFNESVDANIGANNLPIESTSDLALNTPTWDKDINGPGTGVVDFETRFDNNFVNEDSFMGAIDIAIQSQPKFDDQPFLDMLDAHAIDMSKYPTQLPNSNINAPYPGISGDAFSPFENDTGKFNLNTAEGREAFLSSTQDVTAAQAEPNMTPEYMDPISYSSRKYELDRYYNHPRFKDLGFHPFANNDAYYNSNSSKWDNFTRSRAAFSSMFDDAFTSSYRAIGDWFSGDYSLSDLQGAQAMEDAMRIGRSSSGGTRGFFNDLYVNSAYTMGILSNILVEEVALALATAATGGGAGGGAAVRTGFNIKRGVDAIKRLFTAKTYTSAATNLMTKLSKLDNAKAWYNAAKTGTLATGRVMGRLLVPQTVQGFKRIAQSAKAGENMTNLAKGAIHFGNFYRDIRNVNLAWAESKMEGGLVEMELRDQLYKDIYYANKNNAPSIDELNMIAADARQGAFTTQMINFPIIYLSNKLTLGTAMRGFQPLANQTAQSLSSAWGGIFYGGAKKGFKDLGDDWLIGNVFRRMYQAGAAGTLRHAGVAGLKYSVANFAEGIQELAQEATATGVKAFYKDLYNMDMSADLDMQLAEMTLNYQDARKTFLGTNTLDRNPAIDIMAAVRRGVSSQNSAEGFKTFMSGFLMGGLVQGPQRFMFNTVPNIFKKGYSKYMKDGKWDEFVKQKREAREQLVKVLNEIHADPAKFFDKTKLNALQQKNFNQSMFASADAMDILSFFDSQDHAIFSALELAASTGKMPIFVNMLNDMKKMDDKSLKEAFAQTAPNSSADTLRKRLNKFTDRAKEVQKNYNEFNETFVNPFNPKKFDKGTREYQQEVIKKAAFEHARMMALYTKNTFETSLIRSKEIYERLANMDGLKSLNALDIDVLTDPTKLVKELALLEEELKKKGVTKEEKALLENKKKRFELLSKFQEILDAPENSIVSEGIQFQDIIGIDEEGRPIFGAKGEAGKTRTIGRFDRRKIKSSGLEKAFIDYVTFVAESKNELLEGKDLKNIIRDIIDHSYLKGRAGDYYRAHMTLMNPEYMDQYIERLSDIMGDIYKEYTDKNNQTQRLEKYQDKKIRLEWLKALAAEDGIQPDPDETILFLERGIIPMRYFTEEGEVTQQSDPVLYKRIMSRIDDLKKSQSVETAESKDAQRQTTQAEETQSQEEDSSTEPDFESIVGRTKYQQFYQKDKNTQEIIDKLYAQYKSSYTVNDGPFMSLNQWAASAQGGKNIIKSRYELDQYYQNDENIDKTKYPTMDEWLKANQRNPLIVGTNGILTKNDVDYSDVSPEFAGKGTIAKDKLDATEEVVVSDDALGINLIKTTTVNDQGQPEVVYTIVDAKGNNLYSKYSNLDPDGKYISEGYALLPKETTKGLEKRARKAYSWYKNNMSKSGVIKNFAGKKLNTNDIIKDSSGNLYIIKSTPKMVSTFKNLFIVPINNKDKKKGEDDRRFITETEFIQEGFEKVKQEDVNLVGSLTTKVSQFQPIQIIPFNGIKVRPGFLLHGKYDDINYDQDDLFQQLLRTIPVDSTENLEFLIERNPDFVEDQSNSKEYNVEAGYTANNELRYGQNEFQITIMYNGRPIGIMAGLTNTLLFDTDGSRIDGSKITAEQAERLFIKNRGQSAEELAASVRRNYTKAKLITQELKDKLGSAQSLFVDINDLNNVELNITPGYLGWRVNKNGKPVLRGGKTSSTAYEDLDSKTFSTKKGEYTIIYDTRKDSKGVRRATLVPSKNLEPGSREEQDIQLKIFNQLQKDGFNNIGELGMGRYVQFVTMDNGSIAYFEIKLDAISNEDGKQIVSDIKSIQEELISEVKDDKGKFKSKTDKFDPAELGDEASAKLNELNFYIQTAVPGTNVFLRFNKRGGLEIAVKTKDNKEVKDYLNAEDLNEISDLKGLAIIINNRINKSTDAKDQGVKLELNDQSFVPNLPRNLSDVSELQGIGLSANIIPGLRWGQRLDINYTNEDNIKDSMSNLNVDPKVESKPQPTTTTAQPTTQEIYNELLENNFENIPEEIIEGIRQKINDVGFDELEQIEKDIAIAYREQGGLDLSLAGNNSTIEGALEKNEDGVQAEYGNEDLAKKIARKEQELKEYKLKLRNQVINDLKKDNPGQTEGKYKLQARTFVKNNEQVKKLENEIAELKKGLIGKITLINFDQRNVEEINNFIKWANDNLPDYIRIKDVDDLGRRLISKGITLGAFAIEVGKISKGIKDLSGTVYVGNQTGFRYHEAFHAVFRMMLSEADIKRYLRAASDEVTSLMNSQKGYEIDNGIFVKSLLEARTYMRSLSETYSKMSNKELNDVIYEEYLADQFELFKENPSNAKVNTETKNFFQRLIQFIKDLFLSYSKGDLQGLFNDINSGKYKTAEIQNNRFTRTALEQINAPNSMAFAIRKGDPIQTTRLLPRSEDTEIFYINNYFSQQETELIVGTITARFFEKQEALTKSKDFDGKYNPQQLLASVIDEYIEEQNPAREENGELYYAEDLNDDQLDLLDERYEGLQKYKSDVVKSVSDFLNLFDTQIEDSEVILDRNHLSLDSSLKNDEDFEASANEIGGFKSLSKGIRVFFATRFKNVIDPITGKQVLAPVNYVNTYNTFMKALAGITDPNQMLARLKYFENENADTKAVIGDLLAKFNLSDYSAEDILAGNYNYEQVRSQGFFQSILKGFSQLRSDYYQLEVDKDAGIVNIFKSTSRDDASTQIDNWQDHYSVLVNKLNSNEAEKNKAASVFSRIEFYSNKDSITNAELEKVAREISQDIFNTVGMKLAPATVKFIILNEGVPNKTSEQRKFVKLFKPNTSTLFTIEDLQEIKSAISAHGKTEDGRSKANLYYDMTEEDIDDNDNESSTGTDVKFRIKKLAQLNAIFDSTVGATVFRNAEGKLIYAHQMPTYNLEKVAELNTEDALDEMLTNPFMTTNAMLKDPRFRDLVVSGKLRIARTSGVKYTSLEADDNGNYKANNKLGDNRNNKSFGSVSGAEFQALAINLYLSSFNNATGEVTETSYMDEVDGKKRSKSYVTTLNNITVISESNTADFVPLPVLMTVEYKSGKSTITEETIDKFEDAVIKAESERINRERFQKQGYTEDEVLGYNDSDSGRAYRLYNGKNLLSKSKAVVKKLNSLGVNQSIPVQKTLRNNIEALEPGSKQLVRMNPATVAKLNLRTGSEIYGSINTVGDKTLSQEKYLFTNLGVINSETYSIEELQDLLGSDMTTVKTNNNKYKVTLGDQDFYTRTKVLSNWLKGNTTENFITVEKPTPATQALLEATGVIEVTDATPTEQKDINDQVIDLLEKAANETENFTYEEAKAQIEADLGVNIRDLIKQRLEQEFDEHLTLLQNNKTLDSVDNRLLTRLKTSKGQTKGNAAKAMEKLNLIANNPDNHNLKQIFYNEWLNRTLFKQVLLSDPTKLFKDSVDEIKRAKALNAAGPSAQSFISAPYVFDNEGNIKSGLGVNHAVDHISLITFEDINVPARFGRIPTDDKPVTSTDAQMYYTSKAFRYLMFGIGSLTSAQARIMDKIDAGENISLAEFHGAGVSQAGYKSLGAIMNSKKFVYFDGEVFLKMSAFVLSKRLTSDPETNFETALPDSVELHNLRVAMESVEEKGIDTISVAVPASASKAVKKNIVPKNVILNPGFNLSDQGQYDDFINSGYVTDLSAKYMRLQQITPSNKGVVTDPTQIKQLITSEQDNNVIVKIGDKEMSLGEVRALYNKSLGDRVEIKYLQRRNLIFDFQKAQDELQNSIELGEVTVDLSAFLKYAHSSLMASGSSPQFMELFELDETGAQKYDLNNPITQNKFQQLFLAFFSKGQLSEKITGESFALVSNFGKKFYKKVLAIDPETGQPSRWEVIRREDYLKNRQELAKTDYDNKDERTFSGLKVGDIYLDELRMNVKEYDKDGNETGLTYSETAMPAWDSRLSRVKSNQPLPDVVAKMFGVRIPSQDKHSAINLKVVDFLPVEYGSSAMFPTELVEISGADFDIDKLYTHMKEFYMKDGEFIEYGATDNVNQQYQEYLDYMIADARKKGTSMNYALDLWKSRGRITDPATVNDLSLPSEGIIGALKILSLPVTKQEFVEYKEKYKQKIGDKVFYRLPYTAAQSNQVLDLKYAMLGNVGMTEGRFDRPVGAAYEPAVLDPVDDIWKEIEETLPELADLVTEEGVIIESPVGMYRSWVNNKAGAGAIGAAVLPNIIVNILKEYNVSLRPKNERGIPISGGTIEINGYNYNTFSGDYIIDPATQKPLIAGDRKQFIISALVTAATDNAKERLLGKLGLNRNALAITVGLLSLGVDLKTAIMLINQPTIRDIYARVDAGEGSVGRLLTRAMNDLESLNDDAKQLAQDTMVTTDLLIDEIKSPDSADNIEKLAILQLFKNALNLSNKLQALQVLSTNTSFDFTSIEDINFAYQKMNEVGVFMNDKTFDKDTTIPFDARFLFDKDKTFQGRYAAILDNLKQAMPAVFVTMSPTFDKFRNVTKANLPYVQTEKIDKDLLSFFIIKAYMKALNDKGNARLNVSLENGFIYDEYAGPITINTVFDNIKTVLAKQKKSNAFMEFISKRDTKNPVNKAMINMVTSNTWTNISAGQVTNLQNGLRDLYAMPELREDVRHLIHYLILKDGLTYARDTFIDLIPVPLLDDILNVSGNVTDLFNNEDISNGQFVQLFGETRDELLREWVEGYSNSRGNIYFLNEVKRTVGRNQVTSQVVPFKEGQKTKRNRKPILLEQQEDESWTIEFNANHKESYSKKESRKKGKYQNLDFVVDARREKNTRSIKRATNFNSISVEVTTKAGTKKMDLIGFPQEIKMDVSTSKKIPGSRAKKDVRTFVLKYLYTPKEFGNYSDTINFAEENIAYGLKAVYEEIKTKGSMQQYDAGFIHGDRSTYEYLQEKKENRDSAVDTNESAMDKIAASQSKDPIGMGMKGVVINATDKSMSISKEDLEAIKAETKKDREKSNLEKIQEMSENNTDQLNENINVNIAGNSIKVQVKEDPNADYSTIETEWTNLTADQKKEISDRQNIGSAESAIARYKTANAIVPLTQEEFMERLKKCK